MWPNQWLDLNGILYRFWLIHWHIVKKEWRCTCCFKIVEGCQESIEFFKFFWSKNIYGAIHIIKLNFKKEIIKGHWSSYSTKRKSYRWRYCPILCLNTTNLFYKAAYLQLMHKKKYLFLAPAPNSNTKKPGFAYEKKKNKRKKQEYSLIIPSVFSLTIIVKK